MQKITTFLWFDDLAEEAARFYTSIFPNSQVNEVTHYGEGAQKPAGSAFVVTFTLDGQQFMAMNAGPEFKFNESISLYVNCKDQAEVNRYWEALTANGGEEVQCGWLKDRFGVSWQIVPEGMGALMAGPDAAANKRVMEALLKMRKIDLAVLQAARDGK
jgi:predicted 3-demethylubiquinone-9 3-methyltransferase (glyoxalase superfamily)